MVGDNLWNQLLLALFDGGKQTSLSVTDSWTAKTPLPTTLPPHSETKVICKLQGRVLGESHSVPVSGGKG